MIETRVAQVTSTNQYGVFQYGSIHQRHLIIRYHNLFVVLVDLNISRLDSYC